MKYGCFGELNGRCTVLTDQNCNSCKFYATREEASRRRYEASKRLREKGLQPYVYTDENGVQIMSVRRTK